MTPEVTGVISIRWLVTDLQTNLMLWCLLAVLASCLLTQQHCEEIIYMSCLQFALLPRGWLNRYCGLSMRLAYNDLMFEEETVSLQMSLSVALNKLGVLKKKKNIFSISPYFPPCLTQSLSNKDVIITIIDYYYRQTVLFKCHNVSAWS